MNIKKSGALLVGMGIFLSRISGIIRERAFAHYFGTSDAGDAFKVALKIPNFLQNLFGEGVLSASFIPVYTQKITKEINEKENSNLKSSEVALTIGTLLFIVISILVLIGVLLTPTLITIIAPGFQGEKKELTIKLVQIIFPGTGLVVLSAWCLGILNAHRKFFLSYVAPVLWNLAIIGGIIFYGQNNTLYDLAIYTAASVVVGSLLQLLVQLPLTIKLLKTFKPKLNTSSQDVKTILKNFTPSLFSRGVVQISSYIDNIMSSLLIAGSVSNLAYAQTIYLLPVSLFGMSISASELPELSSIAGDTPNEDTLNKLKIRLVAAIKRVSFFIIPSTCAFLFNGDVIVSALFQTGQFSKSDANTVWLILAGFAFGLLASTVGRLYSSTFFSLKDTKTTFHIALVRILFSLILGYVLAFILLPKINVGPQFHVVGLTLASSIAGIIEFYLLKHKLIRVIGSLEKNYIYFVKLWLSAISSSFIAYFVTKLLSASSNLQPILLAFIVFLNFGFFYFLVTYILKINESYTTINKIKTKLLGRK